MKSEIQAAFDYRAVSQEQAMALKEISIRLGVRVQRTADEMLAMGADLNEAKRVCKEDGKLFGSWCESGDCPVGYQTATRLMSVTTQLGDKKTRAGFFDHGFRVLSLVTQTREEDIRSALLEHVEKEAEDGHKITEKEITALKKALKAEQKRVSDLQDEKFDAQKALQGAIVEREAAKAEAGRKEDALKRSTQDALESDRQKRELIKRIEAKAAELRDAEEVHQEHLAEMRTQIESEARNRPRNDAEEKAQQAKLKSLKDAQATAQTAINKLEKEQNKLKVELENDEHALMMRNKIMSEFTNAALQFRVDALAVIGASRALSNAPMTDALYNQIDEIRVLSQQVSDALNEATNAQTL